ncbi:MAG: TetR/AcrR family transcriptional regulator [Cryobacterium sp.]|nr:TetR/AcrR family transcriptional regulator [Cryobacterium sp.]
MSAHSVIVFTVINRHSKAPTKTGRAPRMSVEERQSAILDSVIPLLAVHGIELTSKQIAEAAGVAEGTIFRAFGDKEALIRSAVNRFLDPERMREELAGIDKSGSLEEIVLQIVQIGRRRFGDIFRVMALLGHFQRPKHGPISRNGQVVAEVLSERTAEINTTALKAAQVVRLLTFAATLPHLNTEHEFSDQELASIILYGIAGTPKKTSKRN